jgi:hypothetical protein
MISLVTLYSAGRPSSRDQATSSELILTPAANILVNRVRARLMYCTIDFFFFFFFLREGYRAWANEGHPNPARRGAYVTGQVARTRTPQQQNHATDRDRDRDRDRQSQARGGEEEELRKRRQKR